MNTNTNTNLSVSGRYGSSTKPCTGISIQSEYKPWPTSEYALEHICNWWFLAASIK